MPAPVSIQNRDPSPAGVAAGAGAASAPAAGCVDARRPRTKASRISTISRPGTAVAVMTWRTSSRLQFSSSSARKGPAVAPAVSSTRCRAKAAGRSTGATD